MAIGSLLASRLSRSSHGLSAAAFSQAPRTQHTTSPLLSRLGSVARAFSSTPAVEDATGTDLGTANSYVPIKEGKRKNTKGAKGGKAMMFPLHFHYEDVLRQDLLLKLNPNNVMEVPGIFEIRLVPKNTSDFKIQFGKLAMEILCGQRSVPTQGAPHIRAGKSSKTNPFLASQKEAGSLRQSILRGHGMYNFLVRILTVMSMLDSQVAIEQENCIKFFMETEFCEFSPELEDHFEIFEHIRGFNVTVVTSADTKDATSLLWSGLLLNDEGGN